MPLVRCSKHNIPYNDENPRGCPACALEREGGRPDIAAIRELARASQIMRRPSTAVPPDAAAASREPHPSLTVPPMAPVTPPPRRPVVEEGILPRVVRTLNQHRAIGASAVVIVGAALYVALTSGPEFVEAWDPPVYTGEVHALPVEPGQPIEVLFAILGPRAPAPHPESSRLARYSYGASLFVDALNGVIYHISIGVPNWSWRGLTVGLPQRRVEGELALLGAAQLVEAPDAVQPRTVRGYAAYPSLEARPRRTLQVAVRPPNGCLDVEVDLMPRASGELLTRERRYAVIGRQGAPLEWVSTAVRIVDRAVSGPAGPAAC